MHSTSNNKLDAKRMKGQKQAKGEWKTGREWINDWMTDGDVCVYVFVGFYFYIADVDFS